MFLNLQRIERLACTWFITAAPAAVASLFSIYISKFGTTETLNAQSNSPDQLDTVAQAPGLKDIPREVVILSIKMAVQSAAH